jgi:hypothetical protein
METKFCKHCNKEKDEAEFYSKFQCNSCRKITLKRYYDNNRERIIERQLNYANNNKEYYKDYQKNYREKSENRKKMNVWRKEGIKNISKWYLSKVLVCNYGYEKKEITPLMIEETRKRLIMKRLRKHENFNGNFNGNFNIRLPEGNRQGYSA